MRSSTTRRPPAGSAAAARAITASYSGGTGLNFELIERGIGPEGRLIGVDLTDAMLVQARRRVEAHGWRNVSLIESDIAGYEFPAGMAGVISTFALTLVAEYDAVVARAAAALPAGGRLVVLDLKEPEWAPQWLVTSAAWLTRPFGVTADLARRRPWEAMSRLLTDFRLDDLYFGFAYVASGTVGERRDSVPNRPRAAAIHTTQGARS